MKQINKDELYEHVSGFLKAKGIELKEGAYPKRVQQGCALLSDAINLSQKGIERAKVEVDKKLEQMRQVIHEKTAPKPPPATTTAAKSPAESQNAAPKAAAEKPGTGTKRKAGKKRATRK